MQRPGLAAAIIGTIIAVAGPAGAPIFAADLSVPTLELATAGSVQDGAFVLASLARVDLSVEGGYKFGGTLRFAFDAADLEKALAYASSPVEALDPAATVSADDYNALVERLANGDALGFQLAKVAIREPFSLPIELAYFIGSEDVFCSGDEFPIRFGTASIGTEYRGFAYYPDGIGGDPTFQYDGIYAVAGTGFSLSWTGAQNVVPLLYLYQDAAIAGASSSTEPDRGHYSADARVLVNGKNVKFEAFAGATYPYGDYGLYRGGVLAYFSAGSGAEFLAQIGVPYWNPSTSFGIDNLYFLFEPRVDFGLTSIIVTLFYHPAYYLQRETGEQGATDVNFKLLFGDLRENAVEGGVESTIGLRGSGSGTSLADAFKFSMGPFMALVTEGVRWDFKFHLLPLNYAAPAEMFETYIGVRTAF